MAPIQQLILLFSMFFKKRTKDTFRDEKQAPQQFVRDINVVFYGRCSIVEGIIPIFKIFSVIFDNLEVNSFKWAIFEVNKKLSTLIV
jgi:hypothetical protein